MSGLTWLLLILGILALPYVIFRIYAWRAHGKRNEAGIQMTGRGALMGRLIGRGIRRRIWLRIRMLFRSREKRKEMEHKEHIQTATEAAKLLGSMKGVFMKLGQIVSFAHDALPEQAKGALQGLQKDAPPMAFPLVKSVIEAELGGDLSKTFKEVDEEPLAAASIGQVHRAKLRDGTVVVIKVQYPGVDAAIEGDLKAIGSMGGVISVVNPALDVPSVLAELRARITDELDYRLECRNQALFRRLWDGHPLIRVPRVFPEHTTKRVLVSEHVRGFGFYDFLKEANDREKRIASATIADFVFDSMFCHLAYNGDPHPGNYLFHEDGAVTFIDFGCVKRFTPASMADLMEFFKATIEGDRPRHEELVLKIGLIRPGRAWDKDVMWNAWRYHLEPYWSGDFTFTEDYLARGRVVMAPKNTKDMNLPPDLLFFTRITFGLNAIAQQLGSTGNFNQSARRHFYKDESPSALGLLGIDVPDQFRRLPQLVGAGERVVAIEADGTLPFPVASPA